MWYFSEPPINVPCIQAPTVKDGISHRVQNFYNSNLDVQPDTSVLGRQLCIRSQATESVFREIARSLGYRLQVQGNPSSVDLSSVLSPGTTTAQQALSAMGNLPTLDITVNEPQHLLQVHILSTTTADPGPVIITALVVTNQTVTTSNATPSRGGLPAALKRKLTLQRGDLQSVLRQIAATTGYRVRIHPSSPMGVVGDGLPWGKPAAAAVILHQLGKQSYLDIKVLTHSGTIIVTMNL